MSETIDDRTRDLEQQLEARDILGLRRVITLGIDVEAFMQSPLGRYIQAKANADLEAARDRLQEVDPTDARAVLQAQNDARVPAQILSWLGEAVEAGRNAQSNAINAEAQQG